MKLRLSFHNRTGIHLWPIFVLFLLWLVFSISGCSSVNEKINNLRIEMGSQAEGTSGYLAEIIDDGLDFVAHNEVEITGPYKIIMVSETGDTFFVDSIYDEDMDARGTQEMAVIIKNDRPNISGDIL